MQHPVKLILFKASNYSESDYKRQMQTHKHSSLELSYVINGELTLEFFSEETQKTELMHVFSKQFFIIAPNCPHSVNIPNSVTSLGLEFICENEDILDYLKNSPYIKSLPLAMPILNSFRNILLFKDNQNVNYFLNHLKKYVEPNTEDIYFENSYELDLKRLLIEILKCTKESHKLTNQNIYVKKAVSIIESNYMNNLNADIVAKHIGISEIYLQKLFKLNLGTSVNAFINKTRINKSKALISNTNFSIKKICKDVGYKSVQAFIFNFKKFTNVSPSEFKKKDIHSENSEFFIKNPNYFEYKL